MDELSKAMYKFMSNIVPITYDMGELTKEINRILNKPKEEFWKKRIEDGFIVHRDV